MNVVIIGAQWGDEGKGKIVDYLAEDAKYVVRYSGGPNAGHTIVVDGKQFALHQVPSGILYKDKTVFLGSGMVIDAEALFNELQMLKDNGIDWEGRVFISDRAQLILPKYRTMDKERDAQRKRPIGTTGRGMGIAYAEKAHRDGVRLADLPGYGFAKVSFAEKQRWSELMQYYFSSNRNIKKVFQLIDSRHKPTADDLDMVDFLKQTGFDFVIILTKVDKLKSKEREENFKMFNELFSGIEMIPFSAETGEGNENLRSIVESVI